MRRINALRITVLSISLAVLWGLSACVAAEFTANMVEKTGDKTKTSQLYVKGDNYRIEAREGGEPVVVLVNQSAGTTTIMSTTDKQYRQVKTDDWQSLANDPIQAARFSRTLGENETLGEETVGGHLCEPRRTTISGKVAFTEWIAKDLNFPIKIILYGETEQSMELTDIKLTSLDDSLFVMPSGYTRWLPPSERPFDIPDWASGISTAPVLTPPCERSMSAGDLAVVKVLPGHSIWIKGVAQGDTEAIAQAIPFLDGKPTRNPDMIGNFAEKGLICTRLHETTPEAGEIVIHVDTGTVGVSVKQPEMLEKSVKAGEELRYPISGWDNVEVRLVGLGDGPSKCHWNYFEKGKPLAEEQVGPIKYRTKEIDAPGKMKKTTLSANGDELVFTVDSGEMLIKVGQYDSFTF